MMGFFRQEYWSVLPCPPPGNLPDPGIKPTFLKSSVLAMCSLPQMCSSQRLLESPDLCLRDIFFFLSIKKTNFKKKKIGCLLSFKLFPLEYLFISAVVLTNVHKFLIFLPKEVEFNSP